MKFWGEVEEGDLLYDEMEIQKIITRKKTKFKEWQRYIKT